MTRDDISRLHDRIDDLAKDVAEGFRNVRSELGGVKVDVGKIMAVCPGCTGRVGDIETVLRGPPTNGGNPGIVGRVASLEQSRKIGRWGFYLVWSAIFAVGAAVAGGWAENWFR